jgi:starch phosphorylase
MPTTSLELPAPIAGLETLAYNLRWTWWREKWSLFRWLDPEAWVRTHHNPVRLLAELPPERLREAARDLGYVERLRRATADLDAYLASRGRHERRRIAYFSAEFALTDCIRVFSGGLGVLAGDHLKSSSDLGLPMTAVGLLYRDGYFAQYVDASGWQHETYRQLEPTLLPLRAETARDGSPLLVGVEFPGRTVYARVWRADVGAIPLYLLDTNLDANAPDDRHITDRLYGGDLEHRLKQELILGIGGVRALEALEHPIEVFHLNEGHAAFAIVERLRQSLKRNPQFDAAVAEVTDEMTFTTHTPVEAGHDWFPEELMHRYFAPLVQEMGVPWERFLALGLTTEPHREHEFCMTALALQVSRARNGVSALHGQVSRAMWRGLFHVQSEDEVPIGHITNGVHLPSWVGARMARLYSEYIAPDWRERSGAVDWSRAANIPPERIWTAREEQRARLVDRLSSALTAQARTRGNTSEPIRLDPDALTITFARRFATYKRATLLLSDPARLARILGNPDRPVQIIFAGKAHPRDDGGKSFLQQVFAAGRRSEFFGRIVFIENYDVELARHLVQGSDVWLNVPRRPLEASGTSGMKAAANGGLNLSVADGWWAEAWTEHNHWYAPIGFRIEPSGLPGPQDATDAEVLYRLLEHEVVPMFYNRNAHGIPLAWVDRMRAAIGQVCAFFNTDRMVTEYVERCYKLAQPVPRQRMAVMGVSDGFGG